MTNNFRRFTRYIAAPVICAGVIGGASIGLAGIASASTGPATPPVPNPATTVRGPQIVARPHLTIPQWVPPRHRVVIVPSETGGE
jgi:hypothetical protein